MWIPDSRFEVPELLIPGNQPHSRIVNNRYRDSVLWIYNEPHNKYHEYDNKVRATSVGTASFQGKGGGSFYFNQTYASIFIYPHIVDKLKGEVTTVTRFNAVDAAVTPYGGYAWSQSNVPTSAADYSVAVRSNELRVLWSASGYNYGIHDTTGSQVQANTWYTAVTRRSGSSGNWTSDIFINNTQFTSTGLTNNPEAGTGDPLKIGAIGDNDTLAFDGNISMILIIFESLSDAECMAIQRNPYSIFEPA